ncbi:hypothetical protein SLA2020_065280 [Shorea laevis]
MLRDFMPCLAMVLVQVGCAVMSITSKLAMESGMRPLVLVAYRQIFSVIAIAPLAFFMERNTSPGITRQILLQLFLCSITTVTADQAFYVLGLEYSNATIACALNELRPAVTFVLAVYCRLEKVGIKTVAGQTKVVGTIACVVGSMLLSFYHGHSIYTIESSIHWKYAEEVTDSTSNNRTNFLDLFLIMISYVAWAVGFIIQARLGKKFPAPNTTAAVVSFMASIDCTAIAFIFEHRISAWSLSPSIRLFASLYEGIVCNALALCLVIWSIDKKGPLYVSIFSPLSLLIVAILSFALLHEKLFIGTLAGSVLIVAGFYAVLWGKDKETKEMKSMDDEMETKQDDQKDDLELQLRKINDHPTKIEQKLNPVPSGFP